MHQVQRRARVTRMLVGLLAICAALPVPAAAQTLRTPVPQDFTDFREAEDAQISPDGRLVAFIVEELTDAAAPRPTRVSSVWLVPADGSAPARKFTSAGRSASSPRWSPDSRSIAFLSPGVDGRTQVFLQPAAGGDAVQVTSVDGAVGDFRWSPDGAHIALTSAAAANPTGSTRAPGIARVFSSRRTGSQANAQRNDPAVWLLTMTDHTVRRVTGPDVGVREMVWSPRGDEIAVIATVAGEGNVLAIIDLQGNVRTVAKNPGSFGTRRQVLDWSPDGRTIAFAKTAPDGDVGHWIGLVPAGGGPVRELLSDYDGTLMKAVWGSDSKHLIGQSFERVRSVLIRIDAATGKVTRLGEAFTSYPDFSVRANGRAIAYAGETNESPADIWVQQVDRRSPQRLTRLNPQMATLALGEVSEVTWHSSRDSVELHGVLVTPPGYTPSRRWPTIVQIHGGPHFHWGLGWLGDWHDWAQLLAANGYVVFLPNPRGSTGRDWTFVSAIRRDLGGVDYQDIMDGADALVARGIADTARMGVGGWSFGGFLTAWTVTQTNRFKAAIVGAGITNHFSHAGSEGIGRTDMEFRFGGDPYLHRAAYDERSPITHVRHTRTPTMIVHGEIDAKISVNQAWEFYTALKHLGVDTELIIYPRTGHGIADRAMRIDYLQRVLCWYDTYLRDQTRACGS